MEETKVQVKDIIDTAVDAGKFSTLAKALAAAELVDVLKGSGPFTVLAPTDEAFAKLPAETLESLMKPESKSTLARILKHHVVAGRAMAEQVSEKKQLNSLAGLPLEIEAKYGKVMISGAAVVQADIECSNGVIHMIDRVILPPE